MNGKKIKIISTAQKGLRIMVSICDSVPGVPDLAQKIFDPFFTTKRSSTGIGLSICQRSIQDLGGILSVSTGPLGRAEFFQAHP